MKNAATILPMVVEPIPTGYGRPKKVKALGIFLNPTSAEIVKNAAPGREIRQVPVYEYAGQFWLDERLAKEEAEAARQEQVRAQALKKLTEEEKQLLNLIPPPAPVAPEIADEPDGESNSC